jgi:lysophospholipase L1-like esterase
MKLRPGLPLVLGFLIAGANPSRADLLLSSYTAANPLKVMPVGDSITDDCETNGAWRAPLQPLLETNGFIFTNMGRNISGAVAGFTKRKHEGYCGAVVAPPGVFGPVYSYSSTDNYLQKIVRDALAITNSRSDLMLILIGANDIGRGRNPWVVATNDMPNLLNIIFSNVPNANVVLCKATSLLNAGLGYNVFATNVPIYNAALQAMVNQHRALGQNVFLADMFSAVDYGTMFTSDHVHPNPLGLKAIAKEFATRIQTISIRSNQFATVLLHGGSDWRYNDAGQDLGTDWTQPGFDDSGWSHGLARLGYGDPAAGTKVSFGPDTTNKFITTYFRRSFVVASNMIVTNLDLRLARADGAAVWLNGQEILRTNMPSGPITFTNLALTTMTNFTSHIFYSASVPVTNLNTGTNTLAVEIHLASVTNATMGFDMELLASGNLIPLPSLTITPIGTNLVLSWPISNSSGFSLYSATNLVPPAIWGLAPGSIQTNQGRNIITQAIDGISKFFRLQQP